MFGIKNLTLEPSVEIPPHNKFGDFGVGRIRPSEVVNLGNIFKGNSTIFRWGPMEPILAQDLTKEWQKTRVRFFSFFTFNYDDGQIRPDQTQTAIVLISGHI